MANYTELSPVFARFFQNIPDYPHCTDKLEAGCRQAPKHVAINRRYIEVNKPNFSHKYILNDLDYEGAAFAWEDKGLPAPTFSVINPENLRGHIDYELITAVHLGANASRKAKWYLYTVCHGYTQKLEADPSFGGLLSKNPLSDFWTVIAYDARYELDELAEYVREGDVKNKKQLSFSEWDKRFKEECLIPVPGQYKKKKPATDPSDSLFVFWNTNQYAHTITADYSDDRDGLYDKMEGYVVQLNIDFNFEMRQSEIRSNANSVTKWHWEKRADFVASRKAFCEKQRQRAYLSHKARKKKNNTNIWKVTRKLRKEGIPVTKSSVAEAAGLTRKSMSRRIVSGNVEEAKRLGAYNSHEARKAATEKKIRDTVDTFLREGRKITKSAVAREAGVSRQAINRYYSHLFEL
jgi:DNA-binding XRE family transcriptional regulator